MMLMLVDGDVLMMVSSGGRQWWPLFSIGLRKEEEEKKKNKGKGTRGREKIFFL